VPFRAQNVLFCAVLCTRRPPGRPSVASAGPRRGCSRSLTPCPSTACIRFRRISVFAPCARACPPEPSGGPSHLVACRAAASCAGRRATGSSERLAPCLLIPSPGRSPALCVAGRGIAEVAGCHSPIARHYSSSNGMSRGARRAPLRAHGRAAEKRQWPMVPRSVALSRGWLILRCRWDWLRRPVRGSCRCPERGP
jgi:hypothetical protein